MSDAKTLDVMRGVILLKKDGEPRTLTHYLKEMERTAEDIPLAPGWSALISSDQESLSAKLREGWKIERVVVQIVPFDKEQANSAYGKFAESDEKRLCPKCQRISFHFERCQYLDCGYQPTEIVK